MWTPKDEGGQSWKLPERAGIIGLGMIDTRTLRVIEPYWYQLGSLVDGSSKSSVLMLDDPTVPALQDFQHLSLPQSLGE